MRITLRQLEAFVHIADLASVTAAAERMHLTQPAVSSLIRDLEQAFGGTTLLERTTRSVRLTEAGRTVLRRARLVLSETSTLVEELQGLQYGKSGVISIAATTAVSASLLPRILMELRGEFPDLKYVVHDVPLHELTETVLSGQADVGIGAAASHPELDIQRLVADSLAMIVPAGSALAAKTAMTWSDAAREQTITIRNINVVRAIMDATLAVNSVAFTPNMEVNMIATALSMTAEGLGASILPPFLMPHMRIAEFTIVRLIDPVVPQQISFFTKKRRALSRTAEVFRSLVFKHFDMIAGEADNR